MTTMRSQVFHLCVNAGLQAEDGERKDIRPVPAATHVASMSLDPASNSERPRSASDHALFSEGVKVQACRKLSDEYFQQTQDAIC
jgi:hypothetical protein